MDMAILLSVYLGKSLVYRQPMQKILPQRRTLVIAGLLLATSLALGVTSLLLRPSSTGSGVADIGGPFTMLNHRGETVTEKMLLGHRTLLFFGFTYCPDICPTELQVMMAAIESLGEDGKSIVPVFVSIDPERDTVDVIKSYVENFGPRLIGLTGSAEQIANMAKAYRVYYARKENKDRPQDYQMDHSSILYLMGPDGKFLKHFTYSTDPKALAEALRPHL
jgi:cytochrome oxidase Cu insertion factor (SCO1/SenC/PrrC family)